ncbi:hypothetical protein LEP1GSC133_5123 [Leptospira borgpetersenii serovar Pomona str. 200901868]|uniref:Uncharacterized protein n=1 Tax=Leptospira borgpetersenii serovar Pomona str. 200901868 TaxID=1192866 RepID=M6VTQ4_LEPBO|nr:hypothetical protein LEP1GSC133_5123 [Leptospira borgpetersenii serovar Pomona str. 200901868]
MERTLSRKIPQTKRKRAWSLNESSKRDDKKWVLHELYGNHKLITRI